MKTVKIVFQLKGLLTPSHSVACGLCFHELTHDDNFCPHCGAEFVKKEEDRFPVEVYNFKDLKEYNQEPENNT